MSNRDGVGTLTSTLGPRLTFAGLLMLGSHYQNRAAHSGGKDQEGLSTNWGQDVESKDHRQQA